MGAMSAATPRRPHGRIRGYPSKRIRESSWGLGNGLASGLAKRFFDIKWARIDLLPAGWYSRPSPCDSWHLVTNTAGRADPLRRS
jgi:hypothetical protein